MACYQYDYDDEAAIRGQAWDWDCSAAATAWMGRSLGWGWVESDVAYEFVRAGIATPQLGLLDGTGAGIVRWLSEQPFGAINARASWNVVTQWVDGCPLIMGSTRWYHWCGVRGVDAAGNLRLANSAPGWAGIYQTMSREQFDTFGDFWSVLPQST
jgi:hypothetical protein